MKFFNLSPSNASGKTLINIRSSGQSSNRLFQNLHFEAFCREHGIDCRNPTFADMAKFYVSPCNVETNHFINFIKTNLLGKLFRHAMIVNKIFFPAWLISKLGLIKYVDFDRTKKEKDVEKILLDAFEKHDTVFVGGWNFRVPELVEKHRASLVKQYSLKPNLYEDNEFYKRVIELKRLGSTLVGVHIRRGDYKKWHGGRYYFNDEVYEKYMNAFSQRLLREGAKKSAFVLFSNEKVCFAETSNLMVSKESWFIDHLIMSLCDYLIGPPSTFTIWANYIGNNTLFHIQDDNGGTMENTTSGFRENNLFHD
jgi:hypothetical protein